MFQIKWVYRRMFLLNVIYMKTTRRSLFLLCSNTKEPSHRQTRGNINILTTFFIFTDVGNNNKEQTYDEQNRTEERNVQIEPYHRLYNEKFN